MPIGASSIVRRNRSSDSRSCCDRGLQLTAGRLLCGQQPLTFFRIALRFRDVARDRAHAKYTLATPVANQEVGIRNGDSFVRLEVRKNVSPDHTPRSTIVFRITSLTNERISGG